MYIFPPPPFIAKSPQRVSRLLVFILNARGPSDEEQMTHGREIPTP